MTKDLIILSQKGDSSATLKLIEKFDPLLKKYAYKLYYEDAYNDLLFDYIKFLHNIPLKRMRDTSEGTVVSYICKSIHSSYIKRLIEIKKRYDVVPYSSLSDSELYYAEVKSSAYDTYSGLELTGMECVLTKSELSIIKMIYLLEYSVSETACFYGISRQAVNQTKNRALQKLYKWFEKSVS